MCRFICVGGMCAYVGTGDVQCVYKFAGIG